MSGEIEKRALYREVNDRIRDVNEQLAVGPAAFEVMCECGRAECHLRVAVPFSTYDEVRSARGRFLVAAGHEHPELERVVHEEPGFRIVVEA